MTDEHLKEFCRLIDAELARRELTGDLSLLAAGAAFEAWLAFEARILLERHRNHLGIAAMHWTANEYRKVDLGVWEGSDTIDVAMEFKLIHNNKNWRSKADEAWGDLFPDAASTKAALKPRLRGALVCVVGKVYDDPSAYPGQRSDLNAWEADLWRHLLSADPAGQAERAWTGTRFPIRDPSLSPSRTDHFVQLHLLLPSRPPTTRGAAGTSTSA